MSAVKTAAGAMLGLALLDAVTSSNAAAARGGGLFTALATVIEHVLSPTVAAIPDLRKHGGAVQLPNAAALTGTGTGTGTGGGGGATGGGLGAGSLVPADWTTSASQLYA